MVVPSSGLGNSTTFRVEGVLPDEYHSAAYINVEYPRNFDFSGESLFTFSLPASSNGMYLEISNFDISGTPFLYDLTNEISIETTIAGSTVRIKLPPSSVARELVLINRSASLEPNIEPVTFVNYNVVQGDYIILSNRALFNDGNGTNWVQEYADYRSTTGFNSLVVDVEQLYDQFGYGTRKQLQSFRNFGHFIRKNWTTTPPKYVFIIGKGRGYQPIRVNPTANWSFDLIPPFYDSDNLLITENTSSDEPLFPIGRLAALNPAEVKLYLEKVSQFENNQNLPQTLDDKAWMKRVVHLGGGDPTIQAAIQNNLNSYKSIIENSSYGADVYSFFKTSTDPIQISQSDLLDSLINDGTSMITFFGHSSPNSFDFNLDTPEAYENQNKYPLIFSLGCFTGQLFKRTTGLSEKFVLIENKGAIAFMASGQLSSFGALNSWGDRFYRNVSNNVYGQGIGDAIKATIGNLDNSSFDTRRLNQQMALHGDPAVRLNTHAAPDYLVKTSAVSFEPDLISTSLDSFDMNITVSNIGRNIASNFRLKVDRTLPGGTVITVVDESIPAPAYEGTYTFTLEVGDNSLGQNQFCITVDSEDEISEGPLPFAESNNSFCLNQYILSDDILPVSPYPFSIIPDQGITLKASITNPFAEELDFFFEIDTTELFDSPLKQTTVITQDGGLLEWTPSLTYADSTVYYWRVQVDPTQVNNSSGWKTQSFIYLADEFPGWNQSHYYQYTYDAYSNISLEPNRKFKFIDDFITLKVATAYPGVLINDQIAFFVNGSRVFNHNDCRYFGTMNFFVIDPSTGQPWLNYDQGNGFSLYESKRCGDGLANFAYDMTDSLDRARAMNFIDLIPNGHYLVGWTIDDYQSETWLSDSTSVGDRTIYNTLETLGATQIRNITQSNGNVPYSFFAQKGNPATTQEDHATDIESTLLADYLLPGSWDQGFVETPLIGPALDWGSVHWSTSTTDGLPANDAEYVTIIGQDINNNFTVLKDNVLTTDTTLNFIDAAFYPFIKVQYHATDPTTKTVPQIDYLRVLFDEIPEAALRPEVSFSLDSDTIQQGKDLELAIAVENISNADMDSLLMKFQLVDASNNVTDFYKRYPPLLKGDVFNAELTLPTRNLSGVNQIIIEANPENDQPEQFHFNNIAIVKFYVSRDLFNPLLDVTFDGRHIMEGDLVSAEPNILITLKDENKFLELSDTSLFKILMQYPNEATLREINFNDPIVNFYPANPSLLDTENKATIEINPILVADGDYTLFVQAEDATGNQSGDLDYKVTFKIINGQMISNILNYPNPFTTSTRFVFTLTGTEMPDDIKIQIMTVSGTVVREIMMDELGPLNIGNNITDFAWDGTDQYGDRLANGVYLYRVIAKLNGQDIENYNNNTNQYFDKGFGKMYLMR